VASLEKRNKTFNFGAGPSKIPDAVLLKAQAEFLDYNDTGMSILEISHRTKVFENLINKAKADFKRLLAIPDNYEVFFMQGGGTTQFSAVFYNLVAAKRNAAGNSVPPGWNPPVDYLVTGSWSQKGVEEARRLGGNVNVVFDAKKQTGAFTSIPPRADWSLSGPSAAYIYYCDNETVDGVEFPDIPADLPDGVPLVADMSSNILTRPIDISKFGVIYAGAQKNIGPAGVTIVIIRRDLLTPPNSAADSRDLPIIPLMLDYKTHVDHNSLYNTPPTFGIYISSLVFEWLLERGGVETMAQVNARKAAKLYSLIDASNFYVGNVEPSFRSRMNVTFRIKSTDLEKDFLAGAEKRRMMQLKGHRSVGGIRASIYNTVTEEDIDTLIKYMVEFESLHV